MQRRNTRRLDALYMRVDRMRNPEINTTVCCLCVVACCDKDSGVCIWTERGNLLITLCSKAQQIILHRSISPVSVWKH